LVAITSHEDFFAHHSRRQLKIIPCESGGLNVDLIVLEFHYFGAAGAGVTALKKEGVVVFFEQDVDLWPRITRSKPHKHIERIGVFMRFRGGIILQHLRAS
jgi:hypothetical protein